MPRLEVCPELFFFLNEIREYESPGVKGYWGMEVRGHGTPPFISGYQGYKGIPRRRQGLCGERMAGIQNCIGFAIKSPQLGRMLALFAGHGAQMRRNRRRYGYSP